jgi:hypothetical protein
MVMDDVQGREIYQKGMRDIRKEMEGLGSWRWRLVYQQEDVGLDATIFSRDILDEALERGQYRSLGQVEPHEVLVLGIDPAITGRAAAVLVAYDPRSRVRTVVDLFVGDSLGATGVRSKLMYEFWEKYSPQRTLIEVNYAPTIMGDDVLKARAVAAGTVLLPHKTLGAGRKRGSINDEEYGIAALAPLLRGGMYAFPSATPADRRRLEPLLQDMEGFPFREEKDALVGLWICEGEMAVLGTPRPNLDRVARARNLPPRVVRRMKRG